jgi:predicted AAA+ superfamily ATPase
VEQEYLDRIVDKELDILLSAFGAVLIEGPKWCGKTWTAEKHSSSAIYLQNIKEKGKHLEAAKISPDLLLEGETPRLIDEWQTIPILWDGVRFEVDRRRQNGQFILTGSATPADNATMHTGTGRIARLLMRPMSLFESLESSGDVSLRTIFDGGNIEGTSSLTLEKLAFALIRGGWPVSVTKDGPIALRHAREYVKDVVNYDVSRVDGVEKNPKLVLRIMQSLARNTSTMAKKKTVMEDVRGNNGDHSITDKTYSTYVNALRRLFIIDNLPAWDPAIRSRVVLRASSKHHFVDPSIAAVLLRLSPQMLMQDFKTFGLLFESLCIRDLRIYTQPMEGEVFHYHDGSDLEVDAIIHLYDGRWGAVEVKMAWDDIEKAAENLKKLRDKIDHDTMREPSFLMVLTTGGYALRRKDGVYIVPIECLRD